MINVTVLGGGDSLEREISLKSSKPVYDALIKAGFNVDFIDPIEKDFLTKLDRNHIIFPILHGKNGEDGTIQMLLEKNQIPFLGSTSKSAASSFNKAIAKEIFIKNKIPTAKYSKVNREQYYKHDLIKVPHILKTIEGGSSIGTYIVHNPLFLNEKEINDVFSLNEYALIEEFIQGIEVTVPILDGKALPVIEIQPPKGEEFDYTNKYNGKTKEICPAASINSNMQIKVQRVAEDTFKALDCRHLSRVDIIVKQDGSIFVLENNVIPGMTKQSLYPKSVKSAGMDFPELMTKFVELVRRDYGLE